jgi:hypothetical protein
MEDTNSSEVSFEFNGLHGCGKSNATLNSNNCKLFLFRCARNYIYFIFLYITTLRLVYCDIYGRCSAATTKEAINYTLAVTK